MYSSIKKQIKIFNLNFSVIVFLRHQYTIYSSESKMSLIAILETLAYTPLADSNVIQHIGESNESIRDKIIEELSKKTPDEINDRLACDTHVFSINE